MPARFPSPALPQTILPASARPAPARRAARAWAAAGVLKRASRPWHLPLKDWTVEEEEGQERLKKRPKIE